MSTLSRRAVLMRGLLGSHALLAGCGGGDDSCARASSISTVSVPGTTPQAPSLTSVSTPTAPTPVWSAPKELSFVAGAARSIDLNDTLPAGVPRGGTFSVDAGGASLPAGMVLSADGLLSVAATMSVGVTTGVVFAYACV